MDRQLSQAFLAGEPPFDAYTVAASRLGQGELFSALQIVHSWWIANTVGPIFRGHDWHFHDGYKSQLEPIQPEEISEWLRDEASMLAVLPDDDYVALMFYAPESQIVWRTSCYVCRDDWRGQVDVTAPIETLEGLRAEGKWVLRPSTEFFEPGTTW